MRATASRLEASLRSKDELKLIPYVMAGFPDLARSIDMGKRLAASGAGALEMGIPFSDPLADGPVIQAAGQASLDNGTTIDDCLEAAGQISAAGGAPIAVMTYGNPVLTYGPERFAKACADSGVAGVIIPDLPAEEADLLGPYFRDAGVDQIFLASPTSSEERIARVAAASSGFVYCVTVAGVTGARKHLSPDLPRFLKRVRKYTDLPLAAGFGISQPEHIAELRGVADAAVVASALVAETQAGRDPMVLVEKLLEACRA